jgi:hypothetical protein
MFNHVIFVPVTTNNNIQVASNWNIEFDEIFEISRFRPGRGCYKVSLQT